MMSDMRQMMGGEPGGPEAAANVEQNRSMLNPTDGAFMAQSGQITKGMTVGQFMENVFHVKWEDPIEKLQQASQSQLKNRSPMGKMNALAGQAPQGMPPQGMPPQGPPPGGGGMEDLMAQMGQ